MRLPLQVRFLQRNRSAGEENAGNGRRQTLDAVHILKATVRTAAYQTL